MAPLVFEQCEKTFHNFSLSTFHFTLSHFSSLHPTQSEYHSRRDSCHGDIDHSACRPTEFCGDRAEDDDSRGIGSDEEHIRLLADCYSDKGIDHERDEAKEHEQLDDIEIVLFRVSRAVREDDIEREEHKRIVPSDRVDGQRYLLEKDSRGLKYSGKPAKKIEAHHKAVSRALYPIVFAEYCYRAKIHRHTAHLEREFAPSNGVIRDNVKEEKLLEYLTCDQHARKREQKDLVLFVVKSSAKPRKRDAKR